MQSLGENKTGYRVESIKFVPTDETSRKVHIRFAFLHHPENALPCKAMLIPYQLNLSLSCYVASKCNDPY